MDDLIEELQMLSAALRRPENFNVRSRDFLFAQITGLGSVLDDLEKAVWDEYHAEHGK